jgi:hypothetical protein
MSPSTNSMRGSSRVFRGNDVRLPAFMLWTLLHPSGCPSRLLFSISSRSDRPLALVHPHSCVGIQARDSWLCSLDYPTLRNGSHHRADHRAASERAPHTLALLLFGSIVLHCDIPGKQLARVTRCGHSLHGCYLDPGKSRYVVDPSDRHLHVGIWIELRWSTRLGNLCHLDYFAFHHPGTTLKA